MTNTVPVSVVIPTYQRIDPLRRTLQIISECVPQPEEILVHADAGDQVTVPMLQNEFPAVITMQSETRQGPGGGRNRLIRAATNDTVVSLDDDSWPMDRDFFLHAKQLINSESPVAVYACPILETDGSEQTETVPRERSEKFVLQTRPASSFVGCGCIYRRDTFLCVDGYLPLAQAYGMEETDLSLQLMDKEFEIQIACDMWVYHDCDRSSHHASPAINAAQIRNTALLVFLRYPVKYFPLGLFQIANRVFFSLKMKRYRGILRGIFSVPGTCWKLREERSAVSAATIRKQRMR